MSARYRLFTPGGVLIIGVREIIPCLARVDSFDEEGHVAEYAGQTIYWEDQQPRDCSTTYVCANNKEWTINELTPVVIGDSPEEDEDNITSFQHFRARGKL